MVVGYAFSCLSTLYNVDAANPPPLPPRAELADSPVRPPARSDQGAFALEPAGGTTVP